MDTGHKSRGSENDVGGEGSPKYVRGTRDDRSVVLVG